MKVLMLLLLGCTAYSQWAPVQQGIPGFYALPYHPQFSEVFSSVSNIASIRHHQDLNIGVAYSRFHPVPELSNRSAYISFPLDNSAVLLGINGYGFKNYQETNVQLGYSRNLGSIVLGGRFEFSGYKIPGYAGMFSPGGTVGGILRLSEAFYYGLQIALTASGKESMHSNIISGCTWAVSDQVAIGGEVFHSSQWENFIKIQLQYHPEKFLRFKTGFVPTNMFFISATVKFSGISVEIVLQSLTGFGNSSAIHIIYNKEQQ